MSAAKQTAELVARLKKEGRVVTNKAHAAEIRARIETHATHLSEEFETHQISQHRNTNTKGAAEGVGD